MGGRIKVIGVFEPEEDWHLEDEDGQRLEGALSPVAHLVASLVGCSGLTMRGVMDKMKIEHQGIVIEGIAAISDERPTFVRSISLEVSAPGACINEAQFASILEMTEKYCLIAQTFRHGPELILSAKTIP
ncbi:MAG: OsmC family protein [Bacillota bacterium]|jgi:uncharacterized OsmC-like protein|nr:OsmC family protein [Bacillota bacterium]